VGNLFDAAAAGDGPALAELQRIVRRFARAVFRQGGPPGAPDLDWEDVSQEAWRKLLDSGLRQYAGRGTERAYLFSIVKATAIGMARSARRRRFRENAELPNGVPCRPDPSDGLTVRALLAALPEECRSLLRRAFFEDATYADLAAELGLQESSVRARLSRCLRRARELAAGKEGAR
jgi:RNA polymerase sigma factor (sigma-70 family)